MFPKSKEARFGSSVHGNVFQVPVLRGRVGKITWRASSASQDPVGKMGKGFDFKCGFLNPSQSSEEEQGGILGCPMQDQELD